MKCQEKNYRHSVSGLLSGCDQILLTVLSDIFQNFYTLRLHTQIIVHHSVNFNVI